VVRAGERVRSRMRGPFELFAAATRLQPGVDTDGGAGLATSSHRAGAAGTCSPSPEASAREPQGCRGAGEIASQSVGKVPL
jgi:hypothetical protein